MEHYNCACEYCVLGRDMADNKEMELEYAVAKMCGREMFDEIEKGDRIEYYRIPFSDRKIVYHRDLDLIKKHAEATFQGVVLSKGKFSFVVDNGHIVGAAECWAWGLHKLS